jgi:hypothetical protein|tara:strand:+ start:346 stop:597 length:252 start_codon:yes stop_codon:yes gene_type:complete
MKAIESFIITPANNRNVNGEPIIESILLKYIIDTRLPNIYTAPKNIQIEPLENPLIIFRYSLKARIKQTETKRLNKTIWLKII